jgi:hypothetical protein
MKKFVIECMELVWKNKELYFQWSCLKFFCDNLQIGKEPAI